jgi:hypothetical protein
VVRNRPSPAFIVTNAGDFLVSQFNGGAGTARGRKFKPRDRNVLRSASGFSRLAACFRVCPIGWQGTWVFWRA